MFLDGIDIGLGEVVINDSNATINGLKIPIKCIDIYSTNHEYSFTIWTKQYYEKFNELKLNKKTDILDYIDDYDIDFSTKDKHTINSRENTEVYFTRIDTNKYIMNAIINDFDHCVLGKLKDHKRLEIEAIIDFNQ